MKIRYKLLNIPRNITTFDVTKSKLELTEKGKKIQDSMGLHTKIMNNIKLEGKQANDLIEGMLDEL